ncbi:MAG TPA: DNA double-strand break repair nuclease NurA [Anaerolineae bacterium]|nr:DNA double-strand break repair nuclease NurA [Anaerolineae bacterium]
MTLELAKIGHQILEMGKALAERARAEQSMRPAARLLLTRFAEEQERLLAVANTEQARHLGCASPGPERLDIALPAAAMPERVDVYAADGSQIYPDHHGLAFYFLVNVGGMVFRHGSGQAPETMTSPSLFYREEEVYPEGQPASADLVNALRSVAELRALAAMAPAASREGPACVALGDGPLLFWLGRTEIASKVQSEFLEQYLHHLSALRQACVPVGGFVSRPHSAEVVALLYLAQPEAHPVAGLHETLFRGLTDRALFGFLGPGERSALFVRGSMTNEHFARAGHSIWFFFLNTGEDVARVEVPEWVAKRADWLELVHAVVYGQCRLNNGYPYVLTRADELAVIQGSEREILEGMLVQEMMRQGLQLPDLSRKAAQKRVARWRK